MSAISLINSGGAGYVAGAGPGFFFCYANTLRGRTDGLGGAGRSLYTAAAGFTRRA